MLPPERPAILLPLLLVLCLFPAVSGAAALANQLRNHPSPYLALHAGDPVAWQDWGAAAVARARRENKLLYLSIGYFSCHWCHVMQRESYRNRDIAGFLNKHFIPVKIDRELEPALDARMIAFSRRTRGTAGWPLNVFITPEGYPLYATLYSPPARFLDILERIQARWDEDRDGLTQLAKQMQAMSRPPESDAQVEPSDADAYARKLVELALQYADDLQGGFGRQMKFPLAPQLDFLLAYESAHPQPALRKFLTLTLDQMAGNALHDHLGGGFFRYTVDPGWKTPHFEKMLYDNALLARLYLRAARAFDRPDYRAVGLRTLDFMLSDLCASGSGCIAALSAVDAGGVEGGDYLWDDNALAAVLDKEELALYRRAWGMQDAPPFEAGYLPLPVLSIAEVARMTGREPAAVKRILERAQEKLARAQRKRRAPRDTKRLAGWNGLALAAFAEGLRASGDKRYRDAGRAVREYLVTTLRDGDTLYRSVAGGKALGRAALEDYALVAQGLLAWAEAAGTPEDRVLAGKIARSAWRRYYDHGAWRRDKGGLLPPSSQTLIEDGPIPSPSAMLVQVSLELARTTDDKMLRAHAQDALKRGRRELEQNLFAHATQVGALLLNRAPGDKGRKAAATP